MKSEEIDHAIKQKRYELKCVDQMIAKAESAEAYTSLLRRQKECRKALHQLTIDHQAAIKSERLAKHEAHMETAQKSARTYERHFLEVAKGYMTHGQFAAVRIEARRRADGLPGEMNPPAWVIATKKIRNLALRLSTKLGKKVEA